MNAGRFKKRPRPHATEPFDVLRSRPTRGKQGHRLGSRSNSPWTTSEIPRQPHCTEQDWTHLNCRGQQFRYRHLGNIEAGSRARSRSLPPAALDTGMKHSQRGCAECRQGTDYQDWQNRQSKEQQSAHSNGDCVWVALPDAHCARRVPKSLENEDP